MFQLFYIICTLLDTPNKAFKPKFFELESLSASYIELMAGTVQGKNSKFTFDWLVRGSLTKIGDIFDRLTGRGWKPSSSLATSELIERMKSLLDSEIRENGDHRKYVPHNVTLKMQWDKFSTDSEKELRKLENEFLIAAVDHINDRHYYTYSPLSITVKPDYFTSGVVLKVSFEKFEAEDTEAAVNVTVDGIAESELVEPAEERRAGNARFRFHAGGKAIEKTAVLVEGERISVGRTKENGLQIDDASVSKVHASLLLNKEGRLVVADTGSTNGTFVRGQRIPYGKAIEFEPGSDLMFGLIRVSVDLQLETPSESKAGPAKTEKYKVGEFDFSMRPTSPAELPSPPAPTEPAFRIENASVRKAEPAGEEKPASPPPPTIEAKISPAPQPDLSAPEIKIETESPPDSKF